MNYKSVRRAVSALFATAGAIAIAPVGVAHAGAYDVRICKEGYGAGALQVSSWPGYDHDFVTNRTCTPNGDLARGPFVVINSGGNNPVTDQSGEYHWVGISGNISVSAPPGTGIRKIHIDQGRFANYYGNTSGWNARVMVPSYGWCRTDGIGGESCGFGNQRQPDNNAGEIWWNPTFPSINNVDLGPIDRDVPDLAIGIVCGGGSTWGGHPCYRPKNAHAAGVSIGSASVMVVDNTPPTIGDITGPITWPNTWWKPGQDLSFGIGASDNTGIQAFEKFVDGRHAGTDGMPCNYGEMKPCSDQGHNGLVKVDGFDGFHTVTLRARSATQYALDCAYDCADRTITVAIDGNAPGAPASKNNGPAWTKTNSFALAAPLPASEADPDGSGPQARAPITRRILTVCPAGKDSGSDCVTKDAPPATPGQDASVGGITVPGEGSWEARVRLVDLAGNVGAFSAPVPLRLDVTPPTIAVDQIRGGFVIKGADNLSGAASFRYRVDGAGEWVTAQGASVDVKATPGQHYVEVTATDAAGNQTAKVQRFDITVPNNDGNTAKPDPFEGDSQVKLVDRGAVNGEISGGEAAAEKATLTAWFVKTTKAKKKPTKKTTDLSTRTIGEKSKATIEGLLVDANGKGIAGAKIVMAAQIAGGRTAINKDAATTDGEGNFTIALGPGQTSRTLTIGYMARVNDTKPVASAGLELVVKARASFTAHNPRVGRVKFTGFVSSGYLTKQGVRIEIQWRNPDGGWDPFGSTRTDQKGRWKWFKRFKNPGRYRMRAFVASNPAYAYKGTASRSKVVRIRR